MPDGRDGSAFKEWLSHNKQVKAVTHDCASAYASAIQEILLDALQIADWFHLHQNLLEAIRNTVNAIVPAISRYQLATARKYLYPWKPRKKNVKKHHALWITLLNTTKKVYSSTMRSMNMRLPNIATGQLRKNYAAPGIR